MYVAHDVNQGDRESRDGDCTKSRNGRREQREQRRVCGAGEKTTEVALAENFKDGASAKAPFACARPPAPQGTRNSSPDHQPFTYSRQEHQHRILFPTGTHSTLQHLTYLAV